MYDVFRDLECDVIQALVKSKDAELGMARSWRTLCAFLISLDLSCRQCGALKEFKQESYMTFEVDKGHLVEMALNRTLD